MGLCRKLCKYCHRAYHVRKRPLPPQVVEFTHTKKRPKPLFMPWPTKWQCCKASTDNSCELTQAERSERGELPGHIETQAFTPNGLYQCSLPLVRLTVGAKQAWFQLVRKRKNPKYHVLGSDLIRRISYTPQNLNFIVLVNIVGRHSKRPPHNFGEIWILFLVKESSPSQKNKPK